MLNMFQWLLHGDADLPEIDLTDLHRQRELREQERAEAVEAGSKIMRVSGRVAAGALPLRRRHALIEVTRAK